MTDRISTYDLRKLLENSRKKAMADYHLENIAPQLAAEVIRLREALQTLVDLNDDYAPFGGELYQDRINRAWDNARVALNHKETDNGT